MNEAPASAMKTGTPASRTAMKMKAMTIIDEPCSHFPARAYPKIGFHPRSVSGTCFSGPCSIHGDLMRDIVRLAPARAGVAPDVLDLPDQHQEAAERDAGIDVAHRQVEHCHAL